MGPRPQRPVAAARRRPAAKADPDLREPKAAQHQRLLRAVDLRLREPHHRAARGAHAGGAAPQPDQRQADEGVVVGELGRRSRRLAGDPAGRPDPEEGQRPGPATARRDLHVLPAADLRALPESVVRGLMPVGCDVQAFRGRHRARRPGPLPRLADVCVRMPLQEGVFQPQDRQGREVHAVLSAHRGRPAHGVLGNLCRAVALSRPGALRRGPGAGGGLGRERHRPV